MSSLRFTDRSRLAAAAANVRVVLSVVERLEQRALLSASAVDLTFGDNGRTALPIADARFTSVVVLPNGKVLAAGTVDMTPGGGFQNDFLVARFHANGSIDTTFGGGDGWVNTNFYPFSSSGQAQDFAAAIVQLPNGQFAVAGRTHDGFSTRGSNMAIARYHANGATDLSFSRDGKAIVDFGDDSRDEATALVVTPDNKLLLIGIAENFTEGGTYADLAIAKYRTDGNLDTWFGGGTGKVTRDFGTVFGPDPASGNDDLFADQHASSAALLPNGQLLIAGAIRSSAQSQTSLNDGFVARLHSSGMLDTSFNGGKGFVQTDTAPGAGEEAFSALAVLRDGKILAAGRTQPVEDEPFEQNFLLARFDASGPLDTSFGSAGFSGANFTAHGPAGDLVRSLLVQPTGRILAVGLSSPRNVDQPTRTALARFTASGQPDTSFSRDGKQLSNILPNSGAAAGAATPDGKTVVVASGMPVVVARFGSDADATASISGTFYNDLNGNGVRNSGEGPLSGWQAYADSNNDGFFTPGETSATSGATGFYQIKSLVPGTYRVREVRMNDWNRTQPAGTYPLGFYDATVGLGSAITGRHFGNRWA